MQMVFVKTLKRKRPIVGTTTGGGSYAAQQQKTADAKGGKKSTDPNWRATYDYAQTARVGKGQSGAGQFANTTGKTPRENVADLSPADYEAGRSMAAGGAIDEATMSRLQAAGLLTQGKNGRVVMSQEGRAALVGRQASHVAIMAERAEKKKGEAQAVADKKKLEAENKRKDAESKRESDKQAREKQKAQAVVDKENAKIKAIKDKAEAERRDQQVRKETLENTAQEAGLSGVELSGLLTFVRGQEIPFGSELGDRLEAYGFLTKMPGEFSYTLGGAASPFLNAAMSGNIRSAKDILAISRAQKRAADAKVPIAPPVAGITTPVQGDAERILIPEKRYTPVLKLKPAVKELGRKLQIVFPNIQFNYLPDIKKNS